METDRNVELSISLNIFWRDYSTNYFMTKRFLLPPSPASKVRRVAMFGFAKDL